jgi:hypothetical protein
MSDLDARVSDAVRQFWSVRQRQDAQQGAATGKRDYGKRAAATGGAQLSGFCHLVAELLEEAGLPGASIHYKNRSDTHLPGYFRPSKAWDLIAIFEGELVAALEFKSHIGPSFSNNFNNRVEEALGSATDLWTAYREGAFQTEPRPWLGFLLFLEEAKGSTKSIKVQKGPFNVLEEFSNSSFEKRYELFCRKLVRERLYDGAALILSSEAEGIEGKYREPAPDLCFKRFAASLSAHAAARAKMGS